VTGESERGDSKEKATVTGEREMAVTGEIAVTGESRDKSDRRDCRLSDKSDRRDNSDR